MCALLPLTMTQPDSWQQHLTEDVVDGVRRGDPDAIVTVYRALSGPVYGYLLRQLRDPSWAQDLVADVFCQVLEGGSRFTGSPAGLRAWVFRIARNTLIDHVRKQSHRRHDSLENAAETGHLPAHDSGADPEADALSNIERDRILAAVHELPADQKDVVLLRLVADLSIAHVAELLEKTPGAVKALQNRALRTLGSRLGERGAGEP